jgi:septum formation protein
MLREAGQRFVVQPSGADETMRPGEAPERFAERTALDKGLAVASRRPEHWILAADTIVVLDGDVLGKPSDRAEARRMLRRLSSRTHVVVTAFVLLEPGGRPFRSGLAASEVTFRALADDEIDRYVATDEPLDKAGAYALQGGAGSFVRSVVGSRSNVIGLPLDDVREALVAAGLWRERE